MRQNMRLGPLFILASLLLSAGCSGGGAQIPPSSAQQPQAAEKLGAIHPACGKNLIFVSDSQNNVVDVYPATGTTVCERITNLGTPRQLNGVAVDSVGTLYVLNSFGNVLELKPPYTTVSRTLSGAGGAEGIAICKGYIAVTNFFSPAVVHIYRGDATSPTSTLSDPNATRSENAATCDPAGNLFTTYKNSKLNHFSVNEWLLGKGQPHELTAITALNGFGLDYEGTSLVVGDNHDITDYPRPYTKAGKTIHLQNAVAQFQISASDKNIVADGLDGTVAVYNLTGTVLRTLTLPGTNPDAFGVAYSQDDL